MSPQKNAAIFLAVLLFFLPLISVGETRLLDVKKLSPNIVVEMRYASTNNFTKKQLYPVSQCLLCEPAAKRLAAVQTNLEKKGLGLKVWDCYRPISIQRELWKIVPDPRYVADPKTGSRHNRGMSVDLTLVDSKGHELEMPTPFDEFSSKAHRNFMDLPKAALENRQILQEAMVKEGFAGLATEWWHFDDPEWNKFALRDEPLGSASLLHDHAATIPPEDSTQLILVLSENWAATTGTLQRYEKNGGTWKKLGDSWPINLGVKGMAWGKGLHTSPPDGPQKNERDLTAPAGVYPIGTAYGYVDKPSFEMQWPYKPTSSGWVCVDDSRSAYYNKVFNASDMASHDWKSAEVMRRSDDLYKWVINVEQNPLRTPEGGSCIFMHVWRKAGSPTEGCTAMDEGKIVELLKWLKLEAKPVLVQLPMDAYLSLKKNWNLP